MILTAEQQHKIHIILVKEIITLEDMGAEDEALELHEATISFLNTTRKARQCKGGIHG